MSGETRERWKWSRGAMAVCVAGEGEGYTVTPAWPIAKISSPKSNVDEITREKREKRKENEVGVCGSAGSYRLLLLLDNLHAHSSLSICCGGRMIERCLATPTSSRQQQARRGRRTRPSYGGWRACGPHAKTNVADADEVELERCGGELREDRRRHQATEGGELCGRHAETD